MEKPTDHKNHDGSVDLTYSFHCQYRVGFLRKLITKLSRKVCYSVLT